MFLFLLSLAPSGLARAYSGVADVTLSWGVGDTAISWSSSAQDPLIAVDNAMHFTAESGSSGTRYFNVDFAAANSTSTSTTLTVGGVSNSFASTTVAAAGGGGGGGGGAADLFLLTLLAGLPLWRARDGKRRRMC